MQNIGTSIRRHREASNLTQKELADKLSISPSTIGMYEQNRRSPDLHILMHMASIFGTTLQELIQADYNVFEKKFTDENNHFYIYFSHHFFQDLFKQRLSEAMTMKNLSCSELSKKVSFDPKLCQNFLDGKKDPTPEQLVELASLLNVSIDFLLGNAPLMTGIESRMLNAFSRLNEDNQDIILGRTKELLKEQESLASVASSDCEKINNRSGNITKLQKANDEQPHLMPDAAHERTDASVSPDMVKHDDDIMDDPNF